MPVVERQTEYSTAAPPGVLRPLAAVVLHNTVTPTPAIPSAHGSWHWQILRDGTCEAWVPEGACAWQVRACDRWRPPWVQDPPAGLGVSAVNWCTLGIELVSDAGRSDGQEPLEPLYTDAQYAALAWLARERGYAALPWVGHGQLQRDRSDPVQFDWERAGFGPLETDGRWLLHPERNGGQAMASDREQALQAALDEANAIKQTFEALLRDLEARRRLKRGTVDRLILEARGF